LISAKKFWTKAKAEKGRCPIGYTHYWNSGSCDTEKDKEGYTKALAIIRDIVKRYDKILRWDEDKPRKRAEVNEENVRFNGIGDNGHETFLFKIGEEFEFCKTARKPYDIAVCECLLVLKAHMPNLEIKSDGFSGYLNDQQNKVILDESWDEAIENVRELYGIHFHAFIENERPPYCDMNVAFEGIEEPEKKS